MKKLVVLLMVSLLAASAFAGIDTDANSAGVYFDAAGNNNCATQPAFVPSPAYVVASNPTMSALNGYEFGYRVEAGASGYLRLSETLPAGALNVGVSANGAEGSYVVGLAAPLVTNGQNVVLVSWSVFVTNAAAPVSIFLGPTPIPAMPGTAALVDSDDNLIRLELASGDVNMPVASINGDCPVAEVQSTFGSVKSLFR
jgi:hypothetical protein